MRKTKVSLMFLIIALLMLGVVQFKPVFATETTWQVSASANDIRVSEIGTAHPPWDDADSISSVYASVGYSSYYFGEGLRFTSVTIQKGLTITSAKLQFCAWSDTSGTIVRTRITGEDSDNAGAFSTVSNYNGRPRTSASVTWNNIGAWLNGTWYDSPDITDIIQEIVDREGWTSGNNLVLFWEDTVSDAVALKNFASYDREPTLAPKLVVSYIPDTYYTLSINSIPSSVSFTLNGSAETTPYSQSIVNGTYQINFTYSFVTNVTWTFSHWNDSIYNKNPNRTINLQSNSTYTAIYTYPPKPYSVPYYMPFLFYLFAFLVPLGSIAYSYKKIKDEKTIASGMLAVIICMISAIVFFVLWYIGVALSALT